MKNTPVSRENVPSTEVLIEMSIPEFLGMLLKSLIKGMLRVLALTMYFTHALWLRYKFVCVAVLTLLIYYKGSSVIARFTSVVNESSVIPLQLNSPKSEIREIESPPPDKPAAKGSKRNDHIATTVNTKKVNAKYVEFLKKYKHVAQEEQKAYGIPASITLAQALIESSAGTSYLARNANNYFGMKCFKKGCKHWNCVNRHDDSPRDQFQKFKSVWHSFRAHSKLLVSGRYGKIVSNCGNDYTCWAYAIAAKDYATDKNYPETLIDIINTYRLFEFDE